MNITSWRYVNDVTQLSLNKERYGYTALNIREIWHAFLGESIYFSIELR